MNEPIKLLEEIEEIISSCGYKCGTAKTLISKALTLLKEKPKSQMKFVKELRQKAENNCYTGWLRITFNKAADLIERQQNDAWAAEQYYESTIIELKKQIELLKKEAEDGN